MIESLFFVKSTHCIVVGLISCLVACMFFVTGWLQSSSHIFTTILTLDD